MSRFFLKENGNMMAASGWLFADLMLGLMVIFLTATPPAASPPPSLTVDTTKLNFTDPQHCSGSKEHPTCMLTLGVASTSQGEVAWTANTDISNTVIFKPNTGTLKPGETVHITISELTCQNGSIFFSGSHNANTQIVAWKCTPDPVELAFPYQSFTITIDNIQGLRDKNPDVLNEVKNQIKQQSILQNKQVGLAAVYAGSPDTNGVSQAIKASDGVYEALKQLKLDTSFTIFQRSAFYDSFYWLGSPEKSIRIDVFLYK